MTARLSPRRQSPRVASMAAEADTGLGRIVALCYRPSTSYQIR
jgi:hypothetical protein